MISALDTVEFFAKYAGQRSPIDLPLNRSDLATLFAVFEFKSGAEIGVEQGVYSELLCKANPSAHLLCVDAWRPYPGYREHVTAEKLAGFYRATTARMAPYLATLVRDFSGDAARAVPDRSLDFVYIDAAHDLPSVIADLAAWTPKVRSGGIIAGHDYRSSKGDRPFHVKQAVQAWTSAYRIAPWFVLRGDSAPSWLWVQK